MLRKLIIVILWTAVWANARPVAREKLVYPLPMTGCEETHPRVADFPPVRAPRSLDDYTPNSMVDTAGTTWYDLQANGTAGKSICVDTAGFIQVVWTNGLNNVLSVRHVFFNAWDPDRLNFSMEGGSQVDASSRAGFATIDCWPNGFAFPAFHQIPPTMDGPYAAVAVDFLPHQGAFTSYTIAPLIGSAQIMWPHIAVDHAGYLQVVSTESQGNRFDYYSRGTVIEDPDWGLYIEWGNPAFMQWENASFITMDVATSWHISRVAVCWLQENESHFNDVWLKISEDNGTNWGEPINVTNFPVADTNCVTNGGNIQACNVLYDTLHPWIDCSVMFDNEDNIHIAFTCGHIYSFDDSTEWGPWISGLRESNIWHWSEQYEEFNFMAEGWNDMPNASAIGVNMLQCHRPSLGVDTTTGYLYCSFQKFDSLQTNDAGFAQADAWVTVSATNGRTWAVPTNVSNTDGGIGTPPPGSRSERDITMAKFVTDGIVHLFYQEDHDAGTSIQSEGVATLNQQIYQRIPTEDIAFAPLQPLRAMHTDSAGFPFELLPVTVNEESVSLPAEFTLYQNYPNPFNATTNIQFDLSNPSVVTLKVFDVMGREAMVLMDGQKLNAGAQVIKFEGKDLASGIYFYELRTKNFVESKKMVLLK